MHMIKISPQGFDLELIALRHFVAQAHQLSFDIGPQQSTAILNNEHEMIVQVVNTMASGYYTGVLQRL